MHFPFKNDKLKNYIEETIKVFSQYSVKKHLILLERQETLAETLQENQLGMTAYNPYLDDLLNCSRVVLGIIQWNQNQFFLNLLKQLLNREIKPCQFYQQFQKKYEQNEKMADLLEYNKDLKTPSLQAAIISALIGEIACTIFEEEGIIDICDDCSNSNIDENETDLTSFYQRINEIHFILKKIIESDF